MRQKECANAEANANVSARAHNRASLRLCTDTHPRRPTEKNVKMEKKKKKEEIIKVEESLKQNKIVK